MKSRYTVCYEVLRELRASCLRGEGKTFNVYLAPEVARLLFEEEKGSVEYLETTFETKINISANASLSIDNFQVEGVF